MKSTGILRSSRLSNGKQREQINDLKPAWHKCTDEILHQNFGSPCAMTGHILGSSIDYEFYDYSNFVVNFLTRYGKVR